MCIINLTHVLDHIEQFHGLNLQNYVLDQEEVCVSKWMNSNYDLNIKYLEIDHSDNTMDIPDLSVISIIFYLIVTA